MSRRERGRRSGRRTLHGVMLKLGRGGVLVILLGSALAVSGALAGAETDRPTTASLDALMDADPDSSRAGVGAEKASAPKGQVDAPSDRATLAARLVQREDRRLLELVRAIPYDARPYRTVVSGSGTGLATLVLTPRESAYTVESLRELGALSALTDGTDYLTESVLVAPGARLQLLGANTIRMRSSKDGFATIVAWGGGLEIQGGDSPLRLTSWDLEASAPDLRLDDGRAYVRAVHAAVRLDGVDLDELGFWSGRTSGLAVMGSEEPQLMEVRTRNLLYGVFLSDVRRPRLEQVSVVDSRLDGVMLHGEVSGAVLEGVSAVSSGSHGITATRGVDGAQLSDIVARDNVGDGLRIDGRPLATGPSAGGSDVQAYGDIRLDGMESSGNGGAAVDLVGVAGGEVSGVTSSGDYDGLTVRELSNDVLLSDNHVVDSTQFGISVLDGATEVRVTGNRVDGTDTGIAVRDAKARVEDNLIEAARVHAVSVSGRADGTIVVDNVLEGHGTSALGLSRLVSPRTVVVGSNVSGGWDEERNLSLGDRIRESPLLLLWIPLLMVPLVMVLVLSRRSRTPGARRQGSDRARRPDGHDPQAELIRLHPSRDARAITDTRTKVTVLL